MTEPSAAPPESADATEGPYRVLARKYRPQHFADMIGQEALVRTLSNAIESGRLPHAIILTGVRGVGKTTTARIIAKAINYAGPDGNAGPTVGKTEDCAICRAIAEDRHPDVIEMDAASRTGVDDIRELIEGVRYRPVSARYKVYIIDEVHMLSRNAFNALLKTLEEPPAHVVFIFATTEIRKVPVTVLSRCMRFDLRRVDQGELARHFAGLCDKEGVPADEAALEMIARAADGSVRDGLSLLDQAIALGEGKVESGSVRQMLGLSDRARIYDLFDALMRGAVDESLRLLGDLYAYGADPAVVLQDLLELVHRLTRAKLVPIEADAGLSEAERVRGREMASKLSVPVLGRAWQMLLKGLSEVQQAPAPLQAAEMVLIRLAFAADLPDPGELVRRLSDGSTTGSTTPPPATSNRGDGHAPVSAGGGGRTHAATNAMAKPVTDPQPEAGPRTDTLPATAEPRNLADVVALAQKHGELRLAMQLKREVRLVHFESGRIEINPAQSAPRDLAGTLGRLLGEWTGQRWVVSVSERPGAATLAEQAAALENRRRAEVLQDPLVQAVLDAFPGAEVTRIRDGGDSESIRGPESDVSSNGAVASAPFDSEFDALQGDEEP